MMTNLISEEKQKMAIVSKVLIVDDDPNISQLIDLYLRKEGFLTTICNNGKDAIYKLQGDEFAIVLLDYMMPEMDGIETLTAIRKMSDVPVIMVSAKGEPMDKITGLNVGADDYVTKPFEPQELIHRIRAILRRANKADNDGAPEDISIGKLFISISTYVVKADNVKLEMPPKEIELLYYLASNPSKVLTRQQLLDNVWKNNFTGDSRTVDVHVKRIREKLGVDARRLETIWGVGYKFLID